MQKLDVKAVHERDLDSFLAKLGLDAKFREGEVKCAICGDVVKVENLGAIRSVSGRAEFICTKLECLNKASSPPLTE